MKIILGLGMLAALVSFGAQAADNDLCAANIQKIKDTINSAATSAPQVHKLATDNIAAAKKAQAEGDNKKCIDITSKTITKLNTYTN